MDPRYEQLRGWIAAERARERQATQREIARGPLMPHEIDALGALGMRITATLEEALAELQREHDRLLAVGNALSSAAEGMLVDPRKRAGSLRKAIDEYEKAL